MAEWKRVKIGDALNEVSRVEKLNPNTKYRLLGVRWYGKGVFQREEKLGKEIKATKLYQAKKGDFIYNRLFAWKMSFAIVPDEFDGCLVSNEFPLFICDESKVLADFLLSYILLPQNIETVNRLSGGMSSVSRKRFKEIDFLNFEIPQYDISFQKSICQKLKKISDIAASQDVETDTQLSLLNKLRQAVLQEAVEGKLTAEWRKKNPKLISGEHHASKLLEKIKAEKERLIKEGKIKKEKPLSPIADEEKPFALPEGWVWCRLKDVSLNVHYGFNASARPEKKDVRLLRITDIQNNRVDWNGVPGCAYSERDIKSYLLSENDIVIARTGGTIGKSFLIKDIPVRSLFASYLIRVIPSKNIFPEYLKYFLESPEYWKQLYDAAWGAGQPNVNGTSLSNLIVPLSPFAEQQAIVERVKKLMATIDELKKQVSERKDQAQILMQSVLREAFAG